MEYLIDTHVALWWWANDPQLKKSVRELLSDPDNTIYFSAISGYEILLKNRLGKLRVPSQLINDLTGEVRAEGWMERSLNLSASAMAAQFEAAHRDPFDRILAAQSIEAEIALISIDSALDAFGVNRIW